MKSPSHFYISTQIFKLHVLKGPINRLGEKKRESHKYLGKHFIYIFPFPVNKIPRDAYDVNHSALTDHRVIREVHGVNS